MLYGARVSAGFFDVLGVPLLHGRAFLPQEFAKNAGSVVILSHGLWRDRFAGDPAIVGATIELDAAPCVVVGVMRPGIDLRLFDGALLTLLLARRLVFAQQPQQSLLFLAVGLQFAELRRDDRLAFGRDAETDVLHWSILRVVEQPPGRRGICEAKHDGAVRRRPLGGLGIESRHQDFGAVLLEKRPQTGQVLGAIAVDVVYLLHQDEVGRHIPPGLVDTTRDHNEPARTHRARTLGTSHCRTRPRGTRRTPTLGQPADLAFGDATSGFRRPRAQGRFMYHSVNSEQRPPASNRSAKTLWYTRSTCPSVSK